MGYFPYTETCCCDSGMKTSKRTAKTVSIPHSVPDTGPDLCCHLNKTSPHSLFVASPSTSANLTQLTGSDCWSSPGCLDWMLKLATAPQWLTLGVPPQPCLRIPSSRGQSHHPPSRTLSPAHFMPLCPASPPSRGCSSSLSFAGTSSPWKFSAQGGLGSDSDSAPCASPALLSPSLVCSLVCPVLAPFRLHTLRSVEQNRKPSN